MFCCSLFRLLDVVRVWLRVCSVLEGLHKNDVIAVPVKRNCCNMECVSMRINDNLIRGWYCEFVRREWGAELQKGVLQHWMRHTSPSR